jgi:hypothetical protein
MFVSMGCVSPPLSSMSFCFLSSSTALLATSLASFSTCFVACFATISFSACSFHLASHSVVDFSSASTLAFSLSASIFHFFFSTSFLFFKTFSLSLLFLSTNTSSSSSYTDPECVEMEMGEDHSTSSCSAFFLASSLAFSSSVILPLGWPCLLKMTSSYVWAF